MPKHRAPKRARIAPKTTPAPPAAPAHRPAPAAPGRSPLPFRPGLTVKDVTELLVQSAQKRRMVEGQEAIFIEMGRMVGMSWKSIGAALGKNAETLRRRSLDDEVNAALKTRTAHQGAPLT